MSAYDDLLDEIGIGHGFCGAVINGEPLTVDTFIPKDGRVSAGQFVDWVFRAEGMDPMSPEAVKHAPSIRAAFVRHMGSEVVDAQDLK